MKVFHYLAKLCRIFVLGAGLIAVLPGCQTSPTGRKQLALVSDAQMEEMGSRAFTEMKEKQPLESSAGQLAYIRCVSDAITAALPEKRSWEVALFREDSPNAFALPGGKIGVQTGLLQVAKNEHQLATVIGHEVAHVIADHSKERVSEQLAAQGGLSLLGAIAGNPADPRHRVLLAALGLGAQVGILLPHGRRQESEADTLGLEAMARAGFDPRESVELWKNMAAAGGSQPPEFVSTHPSHGSRIQNLTALMPKALSLYESAAVKPRCR